jgi:hypothetical protein
MAGRNEKDRNVGRGGEGSGSPRVIDAAEYLRKIVEELPESSLPTLLGTLAETKARAEAKLVLPRAAAAGEELQLLTPKQAAPILGTTEDWLYRNANKLPFKAPLSRGQLRFSRAGIRDFIASGGSHGR